MNTYLACQQTNGHRICFVVKDFTEAYEESRWYSERFPEQFLDAEWWIEVASSQQQVNARWDAQRSVA